ncbi:uncharacterized protein LOC124157957 isoform X2 [Ischnura elegans]|uniref:uncharacterized protein LOC124157957 isoform X2 n=1 Tax=Ischnura elegans TaxID=197161 RepID=UPI001ED8B93E|nr:uncharacterized protein LOC124157957 isoform X2 [Ischnura elegans]
MQSSLHGGVEAKGIVATARTDGVDSSRCGSLRLLVRVQHPHRVGVQRSPQHLSLPGSPHSSAETDIGEAHSFEAYASEATWSHTSSSLSLSLPLSVSRVIE